ncbi:MAG: cytochrome c3 family protein [Planctomycetota bacterium]|nr:cytochrome c3 family protein [Planctomycetota bacterium]
MSMDQIPEKAKTRASRIAFSYYNQPDRFYRSRKWFAIVSTLIATGILGTAWILLKPEDTSSRNFRFTSLASPGPVARPHALWESRCEVCHKPAEGLNPERTSPIFHSVVTQDARCLDCHRNAPHHLNSKPDKSPACATCHEDHQGRSMDLTDVGNQHCTKCHINLKDSLVQDSETGRSAIAGFGPKSHPEFRLHLSNQLPENIKFNHALHLSPGQNPATDGLALIRYKDLPEKDRLRYGLKGTDDLETVVTLQCNSCHVQTLTDSLGGSLGVVPSGQLRNPLPVRFERDCAACHPQSFGLSGGRTLAVRHGLQIPDLLEELRALYLKEYFKDNPAILDRKLSDSRIPGKDQKLADPTVGKAIAESVEKGAELLLGKSWRELGPRGRRGCVECHEFQKLGLAGNFKVQPVLATRSKLIGARFDHGRHTMMDCRACHDAEGSRNAMDQLIPKVQNCFGCHGESGLSRHASASAGSSCVTCHGYHQNGKGADAELNSARPALPSQFRSILEP